MLAAATALQLATALAAEPLKLLTGPEGGTQPQIGRDLAWFVAAPAEMTLEVVPTSGPAETLQRLRDDTQTGSGVKLALLQADVAHAYLAAAERGNPDAERWLAPLQVIAPLYAENLYFIVRKNSRLQAVQDMRDVRINVGPRTGGTALAVTSLYRLLFATPTPSGRVSFLTHEQALAKLLTDRSIDVVTVLADSPAKLLANMKPGAGRFIRLLKFDTSRPGSEAAMNVFKQAPIRAADYPNLLTEDLPGLASDIYLVAYADTSIGDDDRLARFIRAWCSGLPRLKEAGHPKWRDVGHSSAELAPGWRRAAPETCR